MARNFTTFALSADLIPVAFPLVRAAIPVIDLATWRRFMEPVVDTRPPAAAGAIGLRNEAGYLCGLMVYRVDRDLRNGATLAVDFFVALDLVNEAAAGRALLHAAEAKALELRCRATHIRLGAEQASLARCIGATGYRPAARLFVKQVSRSLAN